MKKFIVSFYPLLIDFQVSGSPAWEDSHVLLSHPSHRKSSVGHVHQILTACTDTFTFVKRFHLEVISIL